MKKSLIFVPERLAGYPLTLPEAVKNLGVGRYSADARLALSVDDRLRIDELAWQSVWRSLALGDLHAFIQSVGDGSWRRLPQAYWTRGGTRADIKVPSAPVEIVEPSSFVDIPEALIGAPIVVWQDDVAAQGRRLDSMYEKLVEQKAEEDAAVATRRRRQINATPQQIELGRFLSVYEHIRGSLDTNKKRLLLDYQNYPSRKGPPLGRSAFETWLSRYQAGQFDVTARNSEGVPLRGVWLQEG